MRRLTILLVLLVICIETPALPQTTSPQPDPELKKLHALIGHWTYAGENKPGPLGAGGKFGGEYTAQMILGGFFMQGIEKEKGTGKLLALGMEAYDPANKRFASNWYYSNGTVFSGTLTVSGNTFTWAGKLVVAGKEYLMKEAVIVSSDLMSATMSNEISVDGKQWVPSMEGKLLRVGPVAKKQSTM